VSETFVRRARLPAPPAEAFAWHARPGALERLTPPWAPVIVLERQGGIETGGRVVLAVPVLGPLRTRWVAEHEGWEAGRQFRDVQVSGPFASWRHTHRFTSDGEGGCWLEDAIEWDLPLGAVGRLVAGGATRRRLAALFAHRHRVTAADLVAHAPCRARPASVLVSGASGLVGAALVPFLTTGGHPLARLVRHPAGAAGEVAWDPARGTIDRERLAGFDAVVHLAGESIAAGRWTPARKARIRASRVEGTRCLAEALAALPTPPRVLVCASAIGVYGDRGDEILDDASPPGEGFLADVCRAWEAAAEPARRRGIRVVHLRLGVVLTPAGGALARLLPPFRLGVGGRVGSGRQYTSWIAIDDALGAIHHALVTEALDGPVDAVAPEPVRNAEFTRVLAAVLGRPAVVPLPATAARLAFGELADALLLASTRVRPTRLGASGYRFRHAGLEPALRHLLGRGAPGV
jgi:hypothetical protein